MIAVAEPDNVAGTDEDLGAEERSDSSHVGHGGPRGEQFLFDAAAVVGDRLVESTDRGDERWCRPYNRRVAAEDPTEMEWERKLVGRPTGTQHGRSRDDDGSASSNLFVPGSKGVKAQAKIRDIDEDEDSLTGSAPVYVYVTDARAQRPSVLAEIAAGVISHVIDHAVEGTKPLLKRWWNEQALPAIRSTAESTRTKIARSRESSRRTDTTESATSVVPAPAETRVTMSSEEAQQRVVAALMARAFSDEQIRMLLSARIEDVDAFLEWKSSLEQFTSQELEAQLNVMLEAHPSLLDEFVKLFWADRIGAGPGVLVRNESVEEALPLTDGEE